MVDHTLLKETRRQVRKECLTIKFSRFLSTYLNNVDLAPRPSLVLSLALPYRTTFKFMFAMPVVRCALNLHKLTRNSGKQ